MALFRQIRRQTTDDSAFVFALLQHDRAAWRRLCDLSRPLCQHVAAYYNLSHERDDLFSEFILKLLGTSSTVGALRQYRPGAALMPFLTVIMHRVALDRLRRIKARISIADGVEPADCPAAASAPALSEAETDLQDVVAQLPEHDRLLVELHYYHGFTLREMAAITRKSKSAIAHRLQHIHATLRTLMNERGWTKLPAHA